MFPGPDSMGFLWGGVGRALMQFMHFSAIFGMLAVLATSVTLSTTSQHNTAQGEEVWTVLLLDDSVLCGLY